MGCCSSSSESNTNNESSSISAANNNPKRHTCPANGKEYLQVPLSTILHHIKKPWAKNHELIEQSYYFCDDPACDVTYFGINNQTISKTELRTIVGVKEPNNEQALSCYCFDVTHIEAKNNPKVKQYVIDKTKNGSCACETRNPSGRCCLKDFP